jgi:phenylpyruvate tautomerase PptA (4-oxalocrotonate tautomerase family)
MPILDITIPEGSLTPGAEGALLSSLTELILELSGSDPDNEASRSRVWVYLHRPAAAYAGGSRCFPPRYRIVVSVAPRLFDGPGRTEIVREVTDLVLNAEECFYARDPSRVCVIVAEVPELAVDGRPRSATNTLQAGIDPFDPFWLTYPGG